MEGSTSRPLGLTAAFVALAGLATAGAAQPAPARAEPTMAGVCDVLVAPARYDGREVDLHGPLFSDFTGGSSGLTDAACSGWIGIVTDWRSAPPGCDRLDDVMLDLFTGRAVGKVHATLRGRIVLRPGDPRTPVWIEPAACRDIWFQHAE